MADDVEVRLLNDARRRVGAPPPLDVALDIATARRPAIRRPLVVGLAAAASVVLVGGAAGLLAVGRGDHRADPATGPSVAGLAPTRGSDVLRRMTNNGFRGVLLVPGDPRALDIVVPYSTEPGACSLFEAAVQVARQDRSSVRLRTSGYSYLPKAKPGQKYIAYGCSDAGAKSVRVRLDAPLDSRTIYDDVRGPMHAVAPVNPADFPEPRYLPTGYVALGAHPADAAVGRLQGERDYRDGPKSLTLSFGMTGDLRRGLAGERPARVKGHDATISGDSHERCVTWATTPGISREACSTSGPPLSALALSATELLKVARSLG